MEKGKYGNGRMEERDILPTQSTKFSQMPSTSPSWHDKKKDTCTYF